MNDIYMSKKNLNFLNTQATCACEVLLYYAYFKKLNKIFNQRSEKENAADNILRPFTSLSNALYNQICLKLSILFDDSSSAQKKPGNHQYNIHRLIEKKLLCFSPELKDINDYSSLKSILLTFASVLEKDFDESMENVKKYRDKAIAHKDDTPSNEGFNYPVLLAPVKVSFSLLQILHNMDKKTSNAFYFYGSDVPAPTEKFEDFIEKYEEPLIESMNFFFCDTVHG